MSEERDVFGEELTTSPAAMPAPEATTPPETVSAPSVDTQETPAPTPTPAAPQERSDPLAPVKALLDERDRRQAAEREAFQLRAWKAEQERKQAEIREQAPNVLEDPEGYHLWVQQQFGQLHQGFETRLERAVVTERLANSEEKWRDKLGDAKFEEFHAWTGTQHPQWIKQAEAQRDPFGFAYKEFERIEKARKAEELLGKLGDKDLDAFLEEQKQKWLEENSPAANAPAPGPARAPDGKFAPQPSTQRRSAPSLNAVQAASVSPNGKGDSGYFEDEFKRG